jgi:hypothetical protein
MDFIKELKGAINAQLNFPVFQTLFLGIYVPLSFGLIFSLQWQ